LGNGSGRGVERKNIPVNQIKEPGMDPRYIAALEKCPEHRKAYPTF